MMRRFSISLYMEIIMDCPSSPGGLTRTAKARDGGPVILLIDDELGDYERRIEAELARFAREHGVELNGGFSWLDDSLCIAFYPESDVKHIYFNARMRGVSAHEALEAMMDSE